jgi:hypothetical protein
MKSAPIFFLFRKKMAPNLKKSGAKMWKKARARAKKSECRFSSVRPEFAKSQF